MAILNMKRNIIVSIILVVFIAACAQDVYEKPKNLIKEKRMINIMADIHLAEATYFKQSYSSDTTILKLTSSDFYYSVLNKYNVTDSLFESSFVYYASHPKTFEKMYRQVTNYLTEIENANKQDDVPESE